MSAPAATGLASSLHRSGVIKPAVVVLLPVAAALGVMGLLAVAVTSSLVGSQLTPGPPSPAAVADIPAAMLALYRAATAAVCPQMPWQIVAAIGTVESGNGTSNLPGVHSGANSAGAEGPMQFEPATFAAYDYPVPPGGASPPSPYDPIDAVYAAVRMLCANGAGSGDPRAAVFAYNHSAAYVDQVSSIALSYGMAADGSPRQRLANWRPQPRSRGHHPRRPQRGHRLRPQPARRPLPMGRHHPRRQLSTAPGWSTSPTGPPASTLPAPPTTRSPTASPSRPTPWPPPTCCSSTTAPPSATSPSTSAAG